VAYQSGDTSASFFAHYPSCLNLYRTDHEAAPGQVEAVLDFIANRRTVPPEKLENFLAPFRVEQVAKSYEEIICNEGGCLG
jgi:hypothetical protein